MTYGIHSAQWLHTLLRNWVVACRIGVAGAGGRVGSRLCACSQEFGCDVTLMGHQNRWDIASIPDILIDVSHPEAFSRIAGFCAEHRIPLIEGVSGTIREREEELAQLGQQVAVLVAPNFTFGHFLHEEVLGHLAGLLNRYCEAYEFTIAERHPTHKPDRPSATANRLARTWTALSGHSVADIAVVRAGLPVCDHEFSVTLAGESLRVVHAVADRDAAARGALVAALWMVSQPKGMWQMTDVYKSLLDVL